MGIEAVIFDWGGTLTPWHVIDEREQWERFAAGYGTMACARNELTGALLQQWYDASARHRTEHRSTRLADMLAAVGAQPGPATDAGLEAYDEWWVPHGITRPDVEPTFAALKERGLKIGVASNTIWDPGRHRAIFERDGVAHLIDADLYSSELEWTKPRPEVFLEICRRLDVTPTNAVYVGDRLFEDVWGPQQVGMRAIWVPGSQFHDHDTTDTDANPDAVVHDLTDVVTTIDDWNAR